MSIIQAMRQNFINPFSDDKYKLSGIKPAEGSTFLRNWNSECGELRRMWDLL